MADFMKKKKNLPPHQSLGIGIGLFVHDDLGHLVVTAVGGDVKRRQVVVGHVVHRRVVVQQQLHAVEVVALRCHVERRQTVLASTKSVSVTANEKSVKRQAALRRYLGLGENGSASAEQHLHHLLVAAPGSAVQRRQTVLRH